MNEHVDVLSTEATNTVACNENLSTVWRPVVGYEGLYEVSNTGLVRSILPKWKRCAGRVFKPHYDKDGYDTVTLCKRLNGVSHTKTLKVHRLVAMAFIENPDNKPVIDHINGIKNDNRVANLRWCTQSENESNPITKERQREGQRAYLRTPRGRENIMRAVRISNEKAAKPVQCVETGEIWESVHEAARQLGFNQANMSKSCQNYEAGKPYKHVIYRGKPVLHFRWFEKNKENA